MLYSRSPELDLLLDWNFMPKIWFSVTLNDMMRNSFPLQLSLNLYDYVKRKALVWCQYVPHSNIYFYQSNTSKWSENKVRLQVWKQQIILLTPNPTPDTAIGILLTTTFGIYFHISKHYAFTAVYWFINFRHYQLASFYRRKNFISIYFLFSLPPPSSAVISLCWVKPIASVYIIVIS